MVLKPRDMLLAKAPGEPSVIVLSEGEDPRVVTGALAAHKAGLARIILVGSETVVRKALSDAGGAECDGLEIHDPETSELTPALADAYHELRRAKGVDADAAMAAVKTPLVYCAMLVRQGHADGTVGGAVYATGDVVRTAIQCIGMSKQAKIVSSFFLMYPPASAPDGARAMLYADCGLVIDPSSRQLAEIAKASEISARALLQIEPRLALLSFSTKGSASHGAVDKVTNALELLREESPDMTVDGELQFDAAFVPSVAARKAPDSEIAGSANVMIFPNLDAGNISYKITQRVGGYDAIGPVLQGLARPANDLSRGCSAEDVTEMIAVTVLQSQQS